MKILEGYSKIKKNTVLTIGNFDGVHLGHQKLFKLAKIYSKKSSKEIFGA